jgi:NAD(P)-binding Rossmann-like domain
MSFFETDYLIIGSGAVGLAFADTLLDETDAQITIVDRHGLPGGHWNDAYPFVTLHQPSAFYGVNSIPLGSGRIDVAGPNQGFHELASGAEVSAYFQRVMQQRLLPSGRVRYHPLSEWREAQPPGSASSPSEGGHIVSLLSGQGTPVQVRKRVVDASYYGTTVPSTHKPAFTVAEGVTLVPPNVLPQLWQGRWGSPRHFVIIGAGKTAMDAGVWLLGRGAQPEQLSWVVPRDSWLINRRGTQPGMDFFEWTIGGQAVLMEALAQCQTVDELFERLEAEGLMLRIHRDHRPTMFHYATVSEAEVAELRRITQVLRLGRVQAIEPGALQLQHGRVPVPCDTLFIDCSASAVERRPLVPVFQEGRIVLQMVRIPQPAFSAALVAWVEAHGADDRARNAACNPIPLPDDLSGYPRATLVGLQNQMRWGQWPELRRWIRSTRLDGFGRLITEVDPADAAKLAILARLKAAGPPLMFAAARWMSG